MAETFTAVRDVPIKITTPEGTFHWVMDQAVVSGTIVDESISLSNGDTLIVNEEEFTVVASDNIPNPRK